MFNFRKSFSFLFPALGLLVALLTCVGFFIYRAQEENRQRAYQWLNEGAYYQGALLRTKFEGMFGTLTAYAQALALQDLTREEQLFGMQAIRVACNFDYVVIIDSQGRGLNHFGRDNIDLSHRRYFQETRKGRRAVEYLRTGAVDIDRSFVGIAVPIFKEGHYVGAVFGSYNIEYFVELLEGQDRRRNNYVKVVDLSGEELFSTKKSGFADLDNSLRVHMGSLIQGEHAFMHRGENLGTLEFEYTERTYYVTHAPLEVEGNDWHIVNVISADASEVTDRGMDVYVLTLVVQLVVISCLYLVFFYKRTLLQNQLVLVREEAEKASRAKSDFLSRMSHEIRTPMNAIVHMARLAMQEEACGGKLRHCLGKIDDASRILLHLINDILDLAALEGRKIEVSSAPFDIKAMLRSWCSVYYYRCREKGLRFNLIFWGLQAEYLRLCLHKF